MFLLDTKQAPHSTANYLHEGDDKGDFRGMQCFVGEYGVEDPGRPKGGIDDHDGIVRPATSECQGIAEPEVSRSSLEEGKVHEKIPIGYTGLFL